jgi:hypothetical protein
MAVVYFAYMSVKISKNKLPRPRGPTETSLLTTGLFHPRNVKTSLSMLVPYYPLFESILLNFLARS